MISGAPKLPAGHGVTDTVTRVQTSPDLPRSGRVLTRLAVLAAVLVPMGGALAVADTPAGTSPTTPEATTPTTPTTPPTTPVATTPVLTGAATAASITWSSPSEIVEESKLNLRLEGSVNGQATGHIALLENVPGCPASPVYPQQTAAGTRLGVKALPASAEATTPGYLGGTVSHTLTLTPKSAGTYFLCGWVVGSPASNEASTVARFSQMVGVANRPASLAAEIPPASRSGDYFTVKLTGTTPGAGRRVLVMAEKDLTKDCSTLRKAPSGRLPLQTVLSLPTGAFTKTLRLRYKTKTAGAYMLCLQIVEATDRIPEAATQATMQVGEGLKCVSTQTALTQRASDLTVIRRRRDAAQTRLAAAKKKLAPARAKVSAAKRASTKHIATARKAVSRAKSKSGKKKASRRLAQVRRTEAKRVYRAGAPLRKATTTVKLQERTFKQYKTGARLLDETISRTRKDVKRYCASA